MLFSECLLVILVYKIRNKTEHRPHPIPRAHMRTSNDKLMLLKPYVCKWQSNICDGMFFKVLRQELEISFVV